MSGDAAMRVVQFEAPSPDAVAQVTAPKGFKWRVEPDGSAWLQTSGGDPGVVGGVGVPAASDVAGARVRVEVTGSGRVLRVGVRHRVSTQFPVRVDLKFAASALDRVEWADNLEGGRSLQVFPTPWGRSGSAAATGAVWAAVIGLEPEADTPVMDKQLRCHALGAPDKESWNLEPWRPDVPYLDYLMARCNPQS